jgi:hypothetical protein
VGDDAGDIGVYDLQCEQLLKTYRNLSPVLTIAACGDGFVFNQTIGIVYRHNLATRWFCSFDGQPVLKLVTFPNGLVVSCSKITTSVHVHIAWGETSKVFPFAHSLTGLQTATDIIRCGRLLASVHQTEISGPNAEVWLWDARRAHHLHTLPLTCSHICNAISLGGSAMAFIDTSFRLHVYEDKTGCELSKDDNSYILNTISPFEIAYTVCALPDSCFLTTRLHDNNFYILNSQGETIVHQDQTSLPDLHMSHMFSHILYMSSGHVVICQDNTKLSVWK